MHKSLLDFLVCPVCRGPLGWAIEREEDDRIQTAEAECPGCGAAYSVNDGIGIFLTPDLQREDLWKEAESGLGHYLKGHPEIEYRLLSTPLEHLNPADQFFRAMALEAKGDFLRAREAERVAVQGSYTASYRDCWERQVEFLLDRLDATAGPIFDLASGRCALVLRMLARLDRPIVATDFSLPVMRRNRAMLRGTGQGDHVSLLVFDARRTPFSANSIEILTTNLGLPNIKDPGELCREIRRVLSGTFLAISHFYPPADGNADAIREAGLADHLYSESAERLLKRADLRVQTHNSCQGSASPTPVGQVLEGAQIDSLPVADTQLQWSVLEVR
ncbi:MAG TPA: Trm112 family protein [Anaerolineales bacterium]|nr:Trm112 family protein [Anaerolineales bacterium]